jgi:hypothetical protein
MTINLFYADQPALKTGGGLQFHASPIRLRGGLLVATIPSCAQAAALLGLVCLCAGSGWAQRYPAKMVRLLVPFSPGSGSDPLGRIVAGGLTDVFG